MTLPPVRAVLLDADGVLQRNPAGWLDAVRGLVPAAEADRFTDDLWAAEAPALRGERGFADVVAELAGRWDLAGREREVLALWRRVEVDEGVRALVGELRAAGLGCHLATNQNDVRAAYLLDEVGYAALFERCFCSCALGATKDDPAFFAHVLAELGLAAAEVLLVDDQPAYADAARAAGLRAVTWRLDEGLAVLRRRLGEAGVRLSR